MPFKVQLNNTQVIFKNLIPGKYAVKLFQDLNNNKEFDKGFFGVPKESWGVSNDVKANYGPPKFEDMIFVLENDKTIAISMNPVL